MAVAQYIIGTLALFFLTTGSVWGFGTRPMRKRVLLGTLCGLALATSKEFTSNPSWRRKTKAIARRTAERAGLPASPGIVTHITAHTWLTGLYAVEPAATANSAKMSKNGQAALSGRE